MQVIDAKLNSVLWDKFQSRRENVYVFGVRGNSFYLVEKDAPLLDRIIAVFLRFIGSIRTDTRTLLDLHDRNLAILINREETEWEREFREEEEDSLRNVIADITEQKNAEIDQLEDEVVFWSNNYDKIQKLKQKQDTEINLLHLKLNQKDNEIAELLEQIEALKIPLTPKSQQSDSVKDEQIKILKQRLEKLRDPGQLEFFKNLVEAFKNSSDKFIDMLSKNVDFQNEKKPFIDHIMGIKR